jgi:hypothetical protein
MHGSAADTMLTVIEHSSITACFPEFDMIFYIFGYRGWVLSKLTGYAFE